MKTYLYELVGIKTTDPFYRNEPVALFVGNQEGFENFRKTNPRWVKILKILREQAARAEYNFVSLHRKQVLESGEVIGQEVLEEQVL